MMGEQHDSSEHHRLHEQVIARLADADQLAAVVLEMAEQGSSSVGLDRAADESKVRQSLSWKDWPWEAYGPAVMAAVRAGVSVIGANLRRDELRTVMRDQTLDSLLPPAALDAQRRNVRDGHCGLLPEAQIGPMTRVQIARDRSMARAVADAVRPGKTVVLLAGARHVEPIGVPHHLPRALQARAKAEILPATETGKDYCAEMRRQLPAPRTPER